MAEKAVEIVSKKEAMRRMRQLKLCKAYGADEIPNDFMIFGWGGGLAKKLSVIYQRFRDKEVYL